MKIVQINMIKLILIFCLIGILGYTSVTLSKYVLMETDAHIQNSTEFYFESNIADVAEGKNFEIMNWDGSKESLEFNVRNYTNTLLRAEQEISYEIEAEVVDDGQDSLIDKDLITVQLMNEKDELVSGRQVLSGDNFEEKNYILSITKNNTQEIPKRKIFNIKLTINAKTPYTKELVGNIKLMYNPLENYEVKIENLANDYIILNLKVNNPEKDFTVEYDSQKLILDKSNKIVNEITINSTSGKKSFTIPKEKLSEGKNYEIYFIKLKDEEIVLGRDIITK